MRKLVLSACLFLLILALLIPADGRPSKLEPASKAHPNDTPSQPALSEVLRQARILREKGEYAQAGDLFQWGYQEARRRKDRHSEARFLLGVANCHFSQHHYREALQEYLTAKEVSPSSIEHNSLIAINVSLPSLYSRLGEYEAAIDAAKNALAAVPADDDDSHRAMLLIQLATL